MGAKRVTFSFSEPAQKNRFTEKSRNCRHWCAWGRCGWLWWWWRCRPTVMMMMFSSSRFPTVAAHWPLSALLQDGYGCCQCGFVAPLNMAARGNQHDGDVVVASNSGPRAKLGPPPHSIWHRRPVHTHTQSCWPTSMYSTCSTSTSNPRMLGDSIRAGEPS